MEDKDKCSPAPSEGKPKLCPTEPKLGMNSRYSDENDKSRHAKVRRRKEETNSDRVTMPSTSIGNSRTIGKFSTCATPISMLSPQTSERKIHASEKNAKTEERYIVLRTEKELRDYFAAMDRAVPQASPAPDPQPTRSCLSRSSFGSSRSGSGQSVKSVRFADIDDKTDKKNKHSGKGVVRRRSRTLVTGARDMQPVPTHIHDQKASTSIEPAVGHDNRQFKTVGNASTTDNFNGGENQLQITSSESLVSVESSKVHTENKAPEITSCTGSQDTDIRRDKVHYMGKIGHSTSPSVSPLPGNTDSDNCSRTVSFTSSRYSSSGQYTSCSDNIVDEYSQSESTCSSYSHDRRTPNSENSSCCLEKCNSQSISKSYTIVPAAEKSPDESPTPGFDKASSSGSSEYHSRSESRYSENNNSRCGSSVSDSPHTDDSIHNKGKRCRGRLSSPKQNNKPKLEDKFFRREPKKIGPGTNTLKIDFLIENKLQKQHISKVPKNGKRSSRLSPKINASIKCENLNQAVNTLSVLGVPLNKKDSSKSSFDTVGNPYDNGFEEDMESEKTTKDTPISEKTTKDTPFSEKSLDAFWNVNVGDDHQAKRPVISESSKHSTAEFPLIKRRDKTDLIQNSFRQKDPDPEPYQKLSEISMVGTGFGSLATGKQDVKSQKVNKSNAKARGNIITREKHVLKNDPQDLSALIAKELLGDKYQTRKKERKEQMIKHTHKIQTDKAMAKQKITRLPADKQNATKDAKQKRIQIGRLVAADNMYQNNNHDHVRGLMIMGTAKSCPYLNQQPGRTLKPCFTATILPTIHTADDTSPCHSMVSGHTNAPVDTVLPKLSASHLLPQHQEARGDDLKKSCNNARMPCKVNHSHGDIDYNRKKSKERNPSQASDCTLPKLPGPPLPLQAEASLCNGALEVTILSPSDQGGNADPIKLTILHKSRGTGQRMRSSQHQSECGQGTGPDVFGGKGQSQQINTEQSRKTRRGFSHH